MTGQAEQVGLFRFCPACGRPAEEPYGGPDAPLDQWVCTCCLRVWTACPCSPAAEGRCTARY